VRGIEITGFWVPALTLDTHPKEETDDEASSIQITTVTGPRSPERADVKTGRGWGGRVAGYLLEPGKGIASLGVTYLQTEHRERTAPSFTRTHLVLADLRGTWSPGWPVAPYGGGLIGAGGAAVHFHRFYDDTGGAAGELGVLFGIRVLDHVDLGATGVAYLFGWPGHTAGEGVFGSLEMTIRF
jgi:hypothetical protein